MPTLPTELVDFVPVEYASEMHVVECQTHEEYLKQIAELQASSKQIHRVYLYWYEGTGQRKLVVPNGPAAKAMWNELTLQQQMKTAVGMWQTAETPEDARQLVAKYRACLKKDYEAEGGYTEVEGAPEDAVIVIEHE